MTAMATLSEDLVQKAIQGDREATVEIVESIVTGVLYYTTHMLRSRMDAEDAAQNVLIRVCTKINTLKNPATFQKWMRTIVVNETKRYMKKNYKNVINCEEDTLVNLWDVEETNENALPSKCAENIERSRIILEGVGRLTKRQKEAIYNVHYLEMSVKETAKMMGISSASVSDSLSLAYKKIRDKLEESYADGTSFAEGFLAIPLAAEISRTLFADAAKFTFGGVDWAEKTVSGCKLVINGVATAKAIGGLAALFTPAVSAATTVVTVAVVSTGVYFGVRSDDPPPPPPQQQEELTDAVEAVQVATDGGIIFSGGIEGGHVNPMKAYLWLSDEITILGWQITDIDGQDTEFSGEGDVIDDAFARMQDSGMDGRYVLTFSMEDKYGGSYSVDREFVIRNLTDGTDIQTD